MNKPATTFKERGVDGGASTAKLASERKFCWQQNWFKGQPGRRAVSAVNLDGFT